MNHVIGIYLCIGAFIAMCGVIGQKDEMVGRPDWVSWSAALVVMVLFWPTVIVYATRKGVRK